MKHASPQRICLIATTLALAGAACAIALPCGQAKHMQAASISQYKTWRRVNSKTFLLPVSLDGLCRMTTPRDVIQTSVNPHRRKYFTVYVNATGQQAMMREQRPKFPAGSVIVKEKLLTKDGTAPELLTVMVKREPGYSPDSGDWEYRVYNGQGTKVQGAGKLEKCQSCHALNKQTDYVFRSYLPPTVQKSLR